MSKARPNLNAKTLQWKMCNNVRWEAVVLALDEHGMVRNNRACCFVSGSVHQVLLTDVVDLNVLLRGDFSSTQLGVGKGSLELLGRVAIRCDMARPGRVVVAFERVQKLHPHGQGALFDTAANPVKARRMFGISAVTATRVVDGE
eukprot:CAMPEP_0181331164 /NCGR_PEP_ID=MMETSP1101-20121128/24338_1 /TAXON_ID=46948 /ORGANISM="Rhodomonas abbreviata, Strain Caron Lab Isolate" /LENGTH=144 /DNA_ID=CAMNT_0023440571 /DNA_START=162 /DNA_END=596 /DNA_ORIENTATION=-